MGRGFYAVYNPYLQWNEDFAKMVGEGVPSTDCPDSGIPDVSSRNARVALPSEPNKRLPRSKSVAGCAR